jgi:Mg-chelatase subunit ChlD
MKKHQIYIVVFVLFTLMSYTSINAQIRFLSKTYDFGILENWSENPAIFDFGNIGDKEAAIISIRVHNPKIQVQFPQEFTQPNQGNRIYVYYEPVKTGSFKEDIIVYTTSNLKPIILKIKGKVKTIQKCPSVNKANKSKSTFKEGILLDKEKNIPVSGATVTFVSPGFKTFQYETRENGTFRNPFKPGQYDLIIEAEGYEFYHDKIRLSRNTPSMTIELDQYKPEEEDSSLVLILGDQEEKQQEDAPPEENPKKHRENRQHAARSSNPNELSRDMYAPNNIVFLIDKSVSMRRIDKMTLLKKSMKELATVLRDIDIVSIVAFSFKPEILLADYYVEDKNKLFAIIDSIQPRGFTFGVRGISSAYDLADFNFIHDGNNQVILATDGQFNSPDFSKRKLIRMIKKNNRKGITISVIGFGRDEKAIKTMQKMAKLGGGNFIPVTRKNANTIFLIEEIKQNSLFDDLKYPQEIPIDINEEEEEDD